MQHSRMEGATGFITSNFTRAFHQVRDPFHDLVVLLDILDCQGMQVLISCVDRLLRIAAAQA